MENNNDNNVKTIGFATPEALSGTTPTPIKWIYRILGLASAIWILISSAYPQIPVHLQNEILKAIGLGNSIVYTICQGFGYVCKNQNDAQN